MKRYIIIVLILLSCSSIKEVNTIKSIDKIVQRIEADKSKLNDKTINGFYTFGSHANSYKKKNKLYKLEYNIINSHPNIDDIRPEQNLDKVIGEIYFYNDKPILIKEKILYDPPYQIITGIDSETRNLVHSEFKVGNEYKIYILDWENNEIEIENLDGYFSKSHFNKTLNFYREIIKEGENL